jgi:pyruvate dehydrogenase E2 component (dihydrolipoyllysine-residue acetyltransferase)
MSEFRMPFLGADMEGGKLVEWLKQPGDDVHHGEIIAVVETEKGAIEIEVFEDGTVQDITAQLGEYRDVGEVLAHIETSADKAGKTVSPAHISPKMREAQTPDMPPRKRPRISPAALRQAERLGLDLMKIRGTGHNGAITMADVERSAAQADNEEKTDRQPASAPKGIDIARMRTAIAAAMARSKREIPHYYVSATIDVTKAMDWLSLHNKAAPISERVLPVVPLIKAAAIAISKVPQLNGAWREDAFDENTDINIGVAIALRGGGLAAPAILKTDELSVDQLMKKLRDLSGRVRQGNMRGSEIGGATFTLSFVGEGNTESVVPIIYPPQVAILGIGSIAVRPWVVDGEIQPRQLMTATLAGDHRASDGRVGARFLEIFDHLLQEPEAL